jgi:hypothetical protein
MFSCDRSSWCAFSQNISAGPDFALLNSGHRAARQLTSLSRRALACFFRKRTALRKAHIGLNVGYVTSNRALSSWRKIASERNLAQADLAHASGK